jgi:hypothetical protein
VRALRLQAGRPAFGPSPTCRALATGQSRSFSEQQLMDCGWDYGHNKACDGGDYQPAITYLKHAGGAALEVDYPYVGLDSFCRWERLAGQGQGRPPAPGPPPS